MDPYNKITQRQRLLLPNGQDVTSFSFLSVNPISYKCPVRELSLIFPTIPIPMARRSSHGSKKAALPSWPSCDKEWEWQREKRKGPKSLPRTNEPNDHHEGLISEQSVILKLWNIPFRFQFQQQQPKTKEEDEEFTRIWIHLCASQWMWIRSQMDYWIFIRQFIVIFIFAESIIHILPMVGAFGSKPDRRR